MILNKICNSIGNNVAPKKFEQLHGINPRLSYNKANFFYLPRFSTPEMIEARKMNKIALRDIDCFYDKSFKNATYKDYLVLKDNTVESNFTRVRWVNPRDNKAYFLLKDGESDDGIQNIRILDSTGRFIKNAAIKKKTIIVFELDTDKKFQNINNVSHSDLTSIFIRRFNPFADIKICLWKNKFEANRNLLNQINDNVSAISCAFSSNVLVDTSSKLKNLYNKIFHKKLKFNPKELANKLIDMTDENEKFFEKVPSNVRIFMASGNGGRKYYNKYLSFKRVEGVGCLNDKKKLSEFTASRNSYFTQHYEKGEFPVIQLPEGFMFTGTGDIDIPYKSDKFKIINNLEGTSFAVSIRAAKVVLNQMMEGIL